MGGKGRPEIFMEGAWVPICSSGASAGAAGVICKSMGFSGTTSSSKCNGNVCGNAAPGVSELACTGAQHALTKPEMMSSVPLPKVLLLLAQAMGKPRAGLRKKPPPKLQCEWAKQPLA